MNISDTTIPDSTQVNADDLVTGPITVTISGVRGGTAEQPVNIDLVEFPNRAYRPGKSMRRVLIASWGPETSVYTGRRMTLYRDPSIRFGRDEIGGVRISHLSHIDKPIKIALTITRGKREPFIVSPLSNSASRSTESAPTVTRQSLKDAGANMGAGIGDVVTEAQGRMIGALMGKLGLTDTAMQLAYVGDVIERVVTSSAEISKQEASKVITYLQKDEAKLAEEAGTE